MTTHLEELEHAFQDLEGHAHRTSQRVVELERDLATARATERASLDNAMMAVFDVKDRMLTGHLVVPRKSKIRPTRPFPQ